MIEKIYFELEDKVELVGLLHTPQIKTDEIVISIHGMQSNCFKRREDILAKNINDAILSELFKSYDKNTVIDISKGHNKNKSFNNSIDYFKSIHDALYLNYDDCCDYNTDLMKAISECIMKNKISEVITFNFDNILEKNLNSNYKSTKYLKKI